MAVLAGALFVTGLGVCLAGGYVLGTRRSSETTASADEEAASTIADATDGSGDNRYQTVAENFPKGSVALFDDDLRFQLATGGVFDYIEFDPADFENHTITDVFVGEFVEDHREDYAAVFDGEESTFEMRHGDRYYRKHLVPVTDREGTIVAGVEMTRDITPLKERERELQRQNERLEEFASIVSHDLRNPLNVASGRLALIDDETDSEHVESLRDALQRMEALIDDMLTLAQQGQSIDDPQPVDLAAVAEDAWSHVEHGDATLRIDLDRTVDGDRGRVLQLFENLFRNSVEHSKKDVTVTVGSTDHGFFVADDGPGIPEDEHESVFDHGHTTSEDGTGFGLAIVENVASAHGWTVSVTESESDGARFEFDLGDPTIPESEPTKIPGED